MAEKKIIRRRSAGSLKKLKYVLWQAVKRAEDVLLDEEVPSDVQMRAVHSLSQAAANYEKIMKAVELEERIEELEAEAASTA